MYLGYLLYFFYRKQQKKCQKILAKCGATLACVITALIGLRATGSDVPTSLVLWFAFFCMLGDGLLEIHFISGMAAFGAGHLVLICWIYGLFGMSGGVSLTEIMLWAAAYVLTLWGFRKHFRKLGKKRIAFVLYAGILLAMAAMALMLPSRYGVRTLPLAIGGLLFTVSDLLVAKGIFVGLSPAMDRFALAIYYISVYCISLSTWVT